MSLALISAIALWCSSVAMHGYIMVPSITPEKVDTCRAELYQCVQNIKGPMNYDSCFLKQKLNK